MVVCYLKKTLALKARVFMLYFANSVDRVSRMTVTLI